MDVDTNVNSEMSDLVHLAEEWATKGRPSDIGLNRIPGLSIGELRSHKLGKQIITRAAFLLLEQMGIKSVDDYTKNFGKSEEVVEEEKEEKAISPVSPMTVDEFQSILKNGWPIDDPLPTSPFGSRRRTSMLADIIPMSPIASEIQEMSPKKFAMPKLPIRKSEPPPNRKLFTPSKTPRKNDSFRRTNSMPDTPKRGIGGGFVMMTPKRATSTSKLDRPTPPASTGETPLENRASRLRRLKLEEKRKSIDGSRDVSMNSSFGCQ